MGITGRKTSHLLAYKNDPDANESGTWTFFKLASLKGYVDICFYGYYGESVDLYFYPVDSVE